MKMLHVCVAATTVKSFTGCFSLFEQENLTSNSGRDRVQTEEIVWISSKNVTNLIKTWKNQKFLLYALLQTNPKGSKMGVLEANTGKHPLIMPIILLYA